MSDRSALREVLTQNPWFRELPGALAEGIVQRGVVRRLKDTSLYLAGDVPNGLFALISGEIRIIQTTAEGRSALLMIASPGMWFGEAAMIDGHPRTSAAHAVGDAAVLQVGPALFRQLTCDHVDHYAAFAVLVCEQYRKAVRYIVSTASLPLPVRLAQRLIGLAHAHGVAAPEGVRIDLRLSQESLASTIGVSRQTLNGALKRLAADGIVTVGYGAVTILDPRRLDIIARAQVLPLAFR